MNHPVKHEGIHWSNVIKENRRLNEELIQTKSSVTDMKNDIITIRDSLISLTKEPMPMPVGSMSMLPQQQMPQLPSGQPNPMDTLGPVLARMFASEPEQQGPQINLQELFTNYVVSRLNMDMQQGNMMMLATQKMLAKSMGIGDVGVGHIDKATGVPVDAKHSTIHRHQTA